MWYFTSINAIALVFTMLASTSLAGQDTTTTRTFRGLKVVPYVRDSLKQEAHIETYQIDEYIASRNDALGFFNLMQNLSEPSTITTFANYAWNFEGYQKKPFILDADIQIPIVLGGKKWITKQNMIHTLHLIPQFKVRIFQNDENAPGSPDGIVKGDESLPVRTPSYMPRINYYFTFRNPGKILDTLYEEGPKFNFFGLSAFHHSNGQDGPEFYDDPTVKLHNAEYGDINVYNGNFGEDLVLELIYGKVHYLRTRKQVLDIRNIFGQDSLKAKEKGFARNVPLRGADAAGYPYDRRWYYRIGLELHWPDAMTSEVFANYNLYGRYRLNLQGGISWFPLISELLLGESTEDNKQYYVETNPIQSKERWRLVGNLQYILDPKYNNGNLISRKSVPYINHRRLNIYGTVYWTMNNSPYSALFLQLGYWGSDNYNIYFQEQIINAKLGIALAFFKYPNVFDFERNPFRAF